jgi:hypothetical protein
MGEEVTPTESAATASTPSMTKTKQESLTSTQQNQQKKHHDNRHHHRSAFKRPDAVKTIKFTGRCDDLSGHIYDCGGQRMAADTFTKTTKEISEYVGRTYKSGGDMRTAIVKMKKPGLTMPTDPETSASKTEIRIWEKHVDEYVKQGLMIEENLKTAYALIWGQCTDAI